MSDPGRKRPGDESPGNGQKRGRGPADCLDWNDESDEEDFTPYTQENPVPIVVETVSKKSSGGRSKKQAKKSCAKNKVSNASKGKCLGKVMLFVLLCFE